MIMQMMHMRLLWSPVNMIINMIQRRRKRKRRMIMQRRNMAMITRMTMSQLRDPEG